MRTPLRILIVTRNFPPLTGGMERLVWHIADELSQTDRVHVIGPAGCTGHLPQNTVGTELPLRPLPWLLVRATIAAVIRGLRMRPNIVMAGSGLMAPTVWLTAKLCRARCSVYLHGLDIEARHPVYRLAWRPFFRHFDQVMVNSRFTRQLALRAGVDHDRIAVLHPGVTLPDPGAAAIARHSFRERYGLGQKPVMLYVGRISQRKGLAIFADRILPDIVHHASNALLVVIGEEPSDALLQHTGERERIERALAARGIAAHALFLGTCSDAQLTQAYFAADVLIFPVQPGTYDHEGFGMVAVEAAAHGLPTVAFAVGGVPDAIDDGVSGFLVTAGDTVAFANAVGRLLGPTMASVDRAACRRFAQNFAWSSFGNRLRTLCKAMV